MLANLRSPIVAALLLFTWAPHTSPTLNAAPLEYYLPKGTQYSADIPTPREYFGFEIGDRHLQHHQLVSYMQAIAKLTDRIQWQQYAQSHGGRPLIMLRITSLANHQRWDDIRANHLRLAQPAVSSSVSVDKLPAVINMGYSVHGNEASASNAAALVVYHLAAAEGDSIAKLLNSVVILLDPCLNPDGFDRFAHWVNSNRGRLPNADPAHREHNESWPSGRTNYYWFDLNRDWLPAQHPESRGRLRMYHQVKPNVVLDFHEMGGNSTFFFQPGVPTRNHPLTPSRTFELTNQMGQYHARALDAVGSLYYTEERFDDFYMGKGSTYPDLHGAVGILFEQGSARGHKKRTSNGLLTFSFAIRNQFLTSMSSLQATLDMREKLHEHKRTFYREALQLGRKSKHKGYILTARHDPARLHEFARILQQHDIETFALSEDFAVGDTKFLKGQSIVVPTAQPEYRFLLALLEKRTQFTENIFYDVSTWTLPLAFNLHYRELTSLPPASHWSQPFEQKFPSLTFAAAPRDLAYTIDWRGYYAPRTLAKLLKNGVIVKVARQPFRVGSEEHRYGTLVVPLGLQQQKTAAIQKILATAARTDGVRITAMKTGLTPGGIDLGSGYFDTIKSPRVLLVVGRGVRAYEAGETWHLLDHRFRIPTTMVEASRLKSVSLKEYTTLVFVSGSYGTIGESTKQAIKRWVEAGGTLLSVGEAASWVKESELASVGIKPSSRFGRTAGRQPYGSAAKRSALQLISGAIFATSIDTSHPIGYGFSPDSDGATWATVPVFRNNRVMLQNSNSSRKTPSSYLKAPLLSGYVSASNLQQLSNSASVEVHRSGSGNIIVFAENPNFRGFWYGSNRLFLNGLFFGNTIR